MGDQMGLPFVYVPKELDTFQGKDRERIKFSLRKDFCKK